MREQLVVRHSIPREIIRVETRFGALRVKLARRPKLQVTIAPEYDDCKLAADQFHVPLQAVWTEAVEKARAVINPRFE